LETVAIKIPASPQYLHVVRLVAAGLAARLGFTLDDIEDLKIAVDELTTYLTGSQGRRATMELRFSVGDDHIEISGTGISGPGERVRTELTEMSRVILETVVDSASLQHLDGRSTFNLVKRKL
jgi:anti-sigma regulatory factor (Ser/Thr protein kinase)